MDVLNFDLDYEILFHNLSEDNDSYRKFTETLDQLEYVDELFYFDEAIRDNSPKGRSKGLKKAANKLANAVNADNSPLKVAGNAYNKITDAGAGALGLAWKAISTIITAIANVLAWFFNSITNIGKAIENISHRARVNSSKVAASNVNKISLYITSDSIQELYNDTIFSRIDQYVTKAAQAARGDKWSVPDIKHLLKSAVNIDTKITSDLKFLDELDRLYNEFQSLQFEPTVINLKDNNAINMYFAANQNITFTDLKGSSFRGNYYQCLHKMLLDLQNAIKKVQVVENQLQAKYKSNIDNDNFGKLKNKYQVRIQKGISNIGKTTAILGKLVKCINTDINTIREVIDQVVDGSSKMKKAEDIKSNIDNSMKDNTVRGYADSSLPKDNGDDGLSDTANKEFNKANNAYNKRERDLLKRQAKQYNRIFNQIKTNFSGNR